MDATQNDEKRAYLVGGGIASMAAAAFLIRDGNMRGHDITIFEESEKIGGSLDGAGSPAGGDLSQVVFAADPDRRAHRSADFPAAY